MSASNASTFLATSRLWHHIDATGLVVGRLASSLSRVLQGKHKPIYHPSADCGDYVVVTNCRYLKLTGRKLDQKVYYHHTGYPGGLRKTAVKDLLRETPHQVLLRAVKGMLPRSKSRETLLKRVMAFPGPYHPFEENLMRNYISDEFKPFASVIQPLRAVGSESITNSPFNTTQESHELALEKSNLNCKVQARGHPGRKLISNAH